MMKDELAKKSSESRIVFENKKSERYAYGWRDILDDLWNSWIMRVILWLLLPLVILNFWLFRYDDFKNGCHIQIYPSITELNNLDIKKAIRLLKDKSFADYQKMCGSVKSISPELACGGMGGGCFNSSEPEQIVVSTVFRLKESHTETTAAIIMHEVCHLFQYSEKRPIEEGECYREYCRVLNGMGVRRNYDSRCNR